MLIIVLASVGGVVLGILAAVAIVAIFFLYKRKEKKLKNEAVSVEMPTIYAPINSSAVPLPPPRRPTKQNLSQAEIQRTIRNSILQERRESTWFIEPSAIQIEHEVGKGGITKLLTFF